MKEPYTQLQRLAEDECANYCEGECLPADKPCKVITDNGDICRYFAEAVLPLDITLQRAVLSSDADQISMKCCEDCGAGFKPTGRTQRFCVQCGAKRKWDRNALRQKAWREKTDPHNAFSAQNSF